MSVRYKLRVLACATRKLEFSMTLAEITKFSDKKFLKLYVKAVEFAARKHAGQARKGTTTPYLSHCLAVSALVMENGGDGDQAIAALLHDTIEDCGVTYVELKKRFGAKVARIVEDCSDAHGPQKAPWLERKSKHLKHLKKVSSSTLLVSICDKLHNGLMTTRDAKRIGNKVWSRFNEPSMISWYYRQLFEIFQKRASTQNKEFKYLKREFEAIVCEIERLDPA